MNTVWAAILAAPVKTRIGLAVASLLIFGFALVGAALTVDLWLPVVTLAAVAALILYAFRLWRVQKRKARDKERGDQARDLATKFLFFALHRPLNLPVKVERPFSAEALMGRSSVTLLEGLPVARVDLLNLAPEKELLPVDCFLVQQLLSGVVKAFCEVEGLKKGPFNGEFAPLVISDVRGGGAFLTVEIVPVEDEKAVLYLQKKTRPGRRDQQEATTSPAPDDPPCADEDLL